VVLGGVRVKGIGVRFSHRVSGCQGSVVPWRTYAANRCEGRSDDGSTSEAVMLRATTTTATSRGGAQCGQLKGRINGPMPTCGE